MDDSGAGAHKVAVSNLSGRSTQFDAARSRRRFRMVVSLVALLVLAGGFAALSRTQEAVWYLPANFQANPVSTSVTVYVSEQGCTSGQAPSITKPQVKLTESTVTIAVRTRERFAFGQSCPGNPLTPVRVDLSEPLGNRVLIDAYGDLIEGRAPTGDVVSVFKSPPAAQR